MPPVYKSELFEPGALLTMPVTPLHCPGAAGNRCWLLVFYLRSALTTACTTRNSLIRQAYSADRKVLYGGCARLAGRIVRNCQDFRAVPAGPGPYGL